LPVDALSQVWQDGAAMNESEKQFSFTRAALSTGGRAKSNVLSIRGAIIVSVLMPHHGKQEKLCSHKYE
jgi:hypothetical protein